MFGDKRAMFANVETQILNEFVMWMSVGGLIALVLLCFYLCMLVFFYLMWQRTPAPLSANNDNIPPERGNEEIENPLWTIM